MSYNTTHNSAPNLPGRVAKQLSLPILAWSAEYSESVHVITQYIAQYIIGPMHNTLHNTHYAIHATIPNVRPTKLTILNARQYFA